MIDAFMSSLTQDKAWLLTIHSSLYYLDNLVRSNEIYLTNHFSFL